jgi:hypothetical protein
LTSLADGFTSYTTSTKTINQQVKLNEAETGLSRHKERKVKMVEAESTITLAKDSADIFLAPGGNLVQNLLVEESALAASAQFKDSVRDALIDGPRRFREALPFGVGTILPSLPFEDNVVPFLRKSEKEMKAQQLAEKIVLFIANNGMSQSSADRASMSPQTVAALVGSLQGLEPEQAALVSKELRENLPRYGPMVAQLGGKFFATLLNTASYNIETTLSELEEAGEAPDEGVRSVWRGIAAAAQRGATVVSPTR